MSYSNKPSEKPSKYKADVTKQPKHQLAVYDGGYVTRNDILELGVPYTRFYEFSKQTVAKRIDGARRKRGKPVLFYKLNPGDLALLFDSDAPKLVKKKGPLSEAELQKASLPFKKFSEHYKRPAKDYSDKTLNVYDGFVSRQDLLTKMKVPQIRIDDYARRVENIRCRARYCSKPLMMYKLDPEFTDMLFGGHEPKMVTRKISEFGAVQYTVPAPERRLNVYDGGFFSKRDLERMGAPQHRTNRLLNDTAIARKRGRHVDRETDTVFLKLESDHLEYLFGDDVPKLVTIGGEYKKHAAAGKPDKASDEAQGIINKPLPIAKSYVDRAWRLTNSRMSRPVYGFQDNEELIAARSGKGVPAVYEHVEALLSADLIHPDEGDRSDYLYRADDEKSIVFAIRTNGLPVDELKRLCRIDDKEMGDLLRELAISVESVAIDERRFPSVDIKYVGEILKTTRQRKYVP